MNTNAKTSHSPTAGDPIARNAVVMMAKLTEVSFHDHTIAAMAWGGKIWLDLDHLCRNLGSLAYPQQDKVRASRWACWATLYAPQLGTRG